MRQFFKSQLEGLYRTTGLQQLSKMSELPDAQQQIKLLLDELCDVCAWFPLIPEKDKERIISEYMLKDSEFIGFNKKIILKWLNIENPKYFPNQSKYQEINREPAPPDIADKYIEQWKMELAKIGNPIPRTDGIKDQRIQQMKDGFAKLECKHPNWFYFNDEQEICNDCGLKRNVISSSSDKKQPL